MVRFCLRNLRTGEEQYVVDPAKLGELMLRDLREEQAARNGARASARRSS